MNTISSSCFSSGFLFENIKSHFADNRTSYQEGKNNCNLIGQGIGNNHHIVLLKHSASYSALNKKSLKHSIFSKLK